MGKGNIRQATVSGPHGFYPSDPQILRNNITEYLDLAELRVSGAPFGIIAPHAGYFYSGPVAGWAYRQIQDFIYHTVIVLAPSHVVAIPFISVMVSGSYQTPLGDIPIDENLTVKLIKNGEGLIQGSTIGHMSDGRNQPEHSLEVQIPFLQVTLGDFKLVPVIVGSGGWEVCRILGEALAKVCDDDVLIVASTDLSHYHSYDEAYRLDREVIKAIETLDAEAVADGCRKRELEACGGSPVAALLAAADLKGARNVNILRHKTSGDVPGGMRDQVVGYLAAAINSGESTSENCDMCSNEKTTTGSGLEFSTSEQEYLLLKARHSINKTLRQSFKLPEPDASFSVLNEKRGVFVTLKIHDQLRGCIGNLMPDKPLGELIVEVARQAAFDDPRFPPLTMKELNDVSLEITVLGEMVEARSPKDVVVGKHGVMIRSGYNQGLFLPQVATELGWNREQFLDGVCQKAGLPTGAWRKEDAKLTIFTADCFGEEEDL